MKVFYLAVIFSFVMFGATAQKPKNGTYLYKVAFKEWNGKSLGASCKVIIKNDSESDTTEAS